jgi:nitrate reductase alpha subunit
VTRTLLKPTHMVGGYAQLSYGFNYYGTIGSNRDEFVVLRKLARVDWLEEYSHPVSHIGEEAAS